MANILHNLSISTSGSVRADAAYGPAGPGGEVITATGESSNSKDFYFYNTRASIPSGAGNANAVFDINCHGADTEIPIPEGMFVVSNNAGSIGINTTPYGTTSIYPGKD